MLRRFIDKLIDRRVTELLEANNREVERRRVAERVILDLALRVGALDHYASKVVRDVFAKHGYHLR